MLRSTFRYRFVARAPGPNRRALHLTCTWFIWFRRRRRRTASSQQQQQQQQQQHSRAALRCRTEHCSHRRSFAQSCCCSGIKFSGSWSSGISTAINCRSSCSHSSALAQEPQPAAAIVSHQRAIQERGSNQPSRPPGALRNLGSKHRVSGVCCRSAARCAPVVRRGEGPMGPRGISPRFLQSRASCHLLRPPRRHHEF